MTHGWGLCEAEVTMPEDLFRRVVDCYITIAYYAAVAMVGKKFVPTSDVVTVDAWKFAFSEEDLLLDAFRLMFCDALPPKYEQIVQDVVAKHPLKGVAPATISLSTTKARDQWVEHANKFSGLEEEISSWIKDNLNKLPCALPNFRYGKGTDTDEETKGNDYF